MSDPMPPMPAGMEVLNAAAGIYRWTENSGRRDPDSVDFIVFDAGTDVEIVVLGAPIVPIEVLTWIILLAKRYREGAR